MYEKEKLEIKILEFWGRDWNHWFIVSDVRSCFLSSAFLWSPFFLVLGGGLQRTCAARWRVLNISDDHLNWLWSTFIHGWEIKNVLSVWYMTFHFYNNTLKTYDFQLMPWICLVWRKHRPNKTQISRVKTNYM